MNMVIGGKTPIFNADELADLGYGIVLYANAPLQGALAGMQLALTVLRHRNAWTRPPGWWRLSASDSGSSASHFAMSSNGATRRRSQQKRGQSQAVTVQARCRGRRHRAGSQERVAVLRAAECLQAIPRSHERPSRQVAVCGPTRGQSRGLRRQARSTAGSRSTRTTTST
jgi:hypothetical protein